MSIQSSEHSVHLGFTDGLFPSGTHMCMIYSDEEERREILSQYLAAGVADGDRMGYFADVWDLDDLRAYLQEKTGMPIRSLEEKTQCALYEANPLYCPDGFFSPEAMWDKLAAIYRKAREDGYPGIRLTGEMTWSLRGAPGTERLAEYEAGVNQVMEKHPFTAICQYDANRFDGKTLFNVLRVHPYMLAGHQVVANPYFEAA